MHRAGGALGDQSQRAAEIDPALQCQALRGRGIECALQHAVGQALVHGRGCRMSQDPLKRRPTRLRGGIRRAGRQGRLVDDRVQRVPEFPARRVVREVRQVLPGETQVTGDGEQRRMQANAGMRRVKPESLVQRCAFERVVAEHGRATQKRKMGFR